MLDLGRAQFELVWHEHQSVGARCVFQSAVCKVTYVLCDEMCTDDTTCFPAHGIVSVEDLADKCNNGIPYPSMHAKEMRYDGRMHDVCPQIIMLHHL